MKYFLSLSYPTTFSFPLSLCLTLSLSSTGVPDLWDLILDDLRWSWSSSLGLWKNCLLQNQSLVPKKAGTADLAYWGISHGEFAEGIPEYLEFVVDVIRLCDTRLFLANIGHSNLKIKFRHLYLLSPSLHYKSHPLFFFSVISSQSTSDERTVCFPGNMIVKGWMEIRK